MNYSQMTDEELLAEIVLRKDIKIDDFNNLLIDAGKERTYLDTFCDECDHRVITWNPTQDIAAAWELVIAAAEKGIAFELASIHDHQKFWWSASFFDPPGGPMPEVYDAEEGTAPRAICVAWLKLDEAEKESAK